MFRVKAKTTSVKIKDINKYIGRVWMNLSDLEVKKSNDLVLNKNKLFIDTDNEEFKKKFGVKSVAGVVKKINENLSIKEEKKMFVAEPKEIREKESKIKVYTPDTYPEIKLNLMDDVENVKVESTIIEPEVKLEEPFVPEIDEEKILNNLVNIEDNLEEREEFSQEEIDELQAVLNTYEDLGIDRIIEEASIKETSIEETTEEEIPKEVTEVKEEIVEENKYKITKSKRRGRPKKDSKDE